MIISQSEMGCSIIVAIRQAISAKNASIAQASSHHMRAVYHRYQSLNTVESIATLWKDTETAADSGFHYECHPRKARKSPISVQLQSGNIVMDKWRTILKQIETDHPLDPSVFREGALPIRHHIGGQGGDPGTLRETQISQLSKCTGKPGVPSRSVCTLICTDSLLR